MAPLSLSQTHPFLVYGIFDWNAQLYQEPLARPIQPGDSIVLNGRYVRIISNHNGQRLTHFDCDEQVTAALQRRGKVTMT